jgi:uncharacterized membrane protein
MPLSEHEERILAEIERQLAEEDPRFVARARRNSGGQADARRLRWAVVGFVVGLIGLLAVSFGTIGFVFAAIGIALMITSVVVGVSAARDQQRRRPRRDVTS